MHNFNKKLIFRCVNTTNVKGQDNLNPPIFINYTIMVSSELFVFQVLFLTPLPSLDMCLFVIVSSL